SCNGDQTDDSYFRFNNVFDAEGDFAKIVVVASGITAGSYRLMAGGSTLSPAQTENGLFTFRGYVAGYLHAYIRGDSDFIGTITVVSVKKITASLANQADTANLIIIDDTAAKGYGYIGEVGTGEVATALTNNVTGITKADPGVVSSVAHGLAVGKLVYFDSLTEMTELNTENIDVTAVGSADLFSINDTSGYTTAETTGGACGHEVTEPSATAVHIYKDYSLDTPGWNALDTGLDYNAESGWDFGVFKNLMLETTGTAEPRFEATGLLSESFETTNWCLQSNDMTEAVWTATNITPALDVVGADGEANSASRLTATAGNGTIIQSINTLPSDDNCYSVRMKRITGTGNIDLTDDNGANWTTKTLTDEWQRFYVTRSQTDPIVGIRIVTSGDVIAAQFNQLEDGRNHPSSDIPTTTIPVTRTADTQSVAMSTAFKELLGTVADSPFTLVCSFTPKYSYGDTAANANILTVLEDESLFYTDEDGNFAASDDGGTDESLVDVDYVAGTTYTFALRVFLDGTMKYEVGVKDGTWTWDTTPSAYVGSMSPDTDLLIGYLNNYPFCIKNMYVYDTAKEQSWIEGKF
ncbi:MAG: hypothetical protein PF495_14035, partial [Spirochaetales bacterium]|nr:hypothetical protein [Spirochaetales bacterium]